MSFWKRLFSTPEVVEKTVDGVYNGVDKAWFTEEEKADASLKAREIYKKMWMAAVPSALSRRLIAISVVIMWSLVILTMLIAQALGASELAEYGRGILNDIIQNPFNIIIGFYFLKQVVDTYRAT